MDPCGMTNEVGQFNLTEIWQFPLNGVGDSSRRCLAVPNQFNGSDLTTAANGKPSCKSHALSQAVIEGISGSWNRREYESKSGKIVSTIGANEGENKRQKIDEECGERKAEAESPGTETKKQQIEPTKDYIHVRARRGQATDSHSLAERARREKISERMKILQDLVPGCDKVIGKALVLDEIINYIQSLQRQVEFLSMKLEAVNSRMNSSNDVFQPKEFDQQGYKNPEMQFGLQSTKEYKWLHMQIGSGGLEKTS